MQTFLPYSSFRNSAICLDRLRLGKQRLETMQILNTLLGLSDGWRSHPAVKMWRGYEAALWLYGQTMIGEWEARGYKNNMVLPGTFAAKDLKMPPWLGDERVHASHRSNLLRKDPLWYGQFEWQDDPAAAYVWPV